MSVRTRTHHEEILIKLDLRNWTAVPGPVRRIQNTVEMCIATPDKTTWEQHSQSH